ncbi:MAG: hypothetical protein ACOVLE_03280 [Pirellula staleyi]
MSNSNLESGPFAESRRSRKTISLWMLMFSMVVFAGFSMLMMLAARVPTIANSINEFFGLPQIAKQGKPDRTTHLIFLLFCYSSPLLFAMWVGILHSINVRLTNFYAAKHGQDEPDNPFV